MTKLDRLLPACLLQAKFAVALKVTVLAAAATIGLSVPLHAQSGAQDLLRLGTQILQGVQPGLGANPSNKPKRETSGATGKPGAKDADASRVADIQRLLMELGYSVGTIDGRLGSRTREAILAFQHDNGLEQTAQADEFLVGALTMAKASGKQAQPSNRSGEPSFNCGKAGNSTERAICQSEELAALDRKMAEVYPVVLDSGSFSAQSQTDWLKLRNKCANDSDCIGRSYRARLAEFGSAAGSDQASATYPESSESEVSRIQREGEVSPEIGSTQSPPSQVAQPSVAVDDNQETADKLRQILNLCKQNQVLSRTVKCECIIPYARSEIAKNPSTHVNNILFRVNQDFGATCRNNEAIYAYNIEECARNYSDGMYLTKMNRESFCHCYADVAHKLGGARAIAQCQATKNYSVPPDSPLLVASNVNDRAAQKTAEMKVPGKVEYCEARADNYVKALKMYFDGVSREDALRNLLELNSNAHPQIKSQVQYDVRQAYLRRQKTTMPEEKEARALYREICLEL